MRVVLLLIALSFLGCKEEIVPERYRPRNAHDAYRYGLETAGLAQSALGKDWIEASTRSLSAPTQIQSPYQESLFFDPSRAQAAGYVLEVKRGQKIEVKVEVPADSQRIFIDLYHFNRESGTWRHVASADSVYHQLGFEPRRDAPYVLRVQPELLRGGNYKIQVRQVPALNFPVAGKNSRAIGSYFGDPRDGGRRDHHGVDIFARKRTPVLAPSKAYVRDVAIRGLGGKVVWLYDSKRRMNMYFAHLDSQMVRERTYVDPGDTIGLIGNTGNARYTPPHLHFGIYSNGPVDPLFYLKETNTEFEPITASDTTLGEYMRLSETGFLKADLGHTVIDTLQKASVVKILAAANGHYRVEAVNGIVGYLTTTTLESTDEPIKSVRLDRYVNLFAEPEKAVIGELFSGDSIHVFGNHMDYQLVQAPSGTIGWITAQQSASTSPGD